MSIPDASFKKISATDWSSKLNALGEIVEGYDDIKQCIEIILLTSKGSVPHRPEFGCDIFKYLDLPANHAVPRLVYEAHEALKRWEPRIDVESVTAEAKEAHHYLLTITWRPKAEYEQQISQEVIL